MKQLGQILQELLQRINDERVRKNQNLGNLKGGNK